MFSITKDYAFTKQLTENLRKHYESNKRLEGEPVHVSDLESSSWLGSSTIIANFQVSNVISEDSVYNFVRGEKAANI